MQPVFTTTAGPSNVGPTHKATTTGGYVRSITQQTAPHPAMVGVVGWRIAQKTRVLGNLVLGPPTKLWLVVNHLTRS